LRAADHAVPLGGSDANTIEQSLASSAAPENQASVSVPSGSCSIVAAWFDLNGGIRCASNEPSPASRMTPSKCAGGGAGVGGPGGGGGAGPGGFAAQPGTVGRQPLVTWSLAPPPNFLQFVVKQWCEFWFHEKTVCLALVAAASQAARVFSVDFFAALRLQSASNRGTTIQLAAAATVGSSS
jgi:hypothetical protein